MARHAAAAAAPFSRLYASVESWPYVIYNFNAQQTVEEWPNRTPYIPKISYVLRCRSRRIIIIPRNQNMDLYIDT